MHHELFQPVHTVDFIIYCEELMRLNSTFKVKRNKIMINGKSFIFHHNNARPHTSLITLQTLKEMSWEVLMHPKYSQVFNPANYHLFLTLQKTLNGVRLVSKEACEKSLFQFFFSEIPEFKK